MALRILIPSKKSENLFFEELIRYSKNTFTYGDLDADITKFDVVVLHWPEQLFNWQTPSTTQLNKLKTTLLNWSKYVKIIYVAHNKKPHLKDNFQFKTLYKIVLGSCDVMVHFGDYSKTLYAKKYPKKEHVIISHPLYSQSFKKYSNKKARQELGISLHKKIILVPGKIRTLQERQLIVKAFKRLKLKNKLLVVPNMYKKSLPSFKGSYRLQRLPIVKNILFFLCNLEMLWSYRFTYKHVSNQSLALLMSASDVIVIPRIDVLNSGNVYLGLTYKKRIVGPEVGNITEVLQTFNCPVYIPNNVKSLSKSIMKAIKDVKTYNTDLLNAYHPQVIAKQWDELILMTKNN